MRKMLFRLYRPKVSCVCLYLCPVIRALWLTRTVRFRPAFLESRRVGLEYFLK